MVAVAISMLTIRAADGAPTLSLTMREAAFRQVWTRVRDNFYDPHMNGVNWDAVRRRYAPLIARAKSDDAFYALLNEMVGELKASHFGVIPPDTDVAETSAQDHSEEGETGVTAQLVADLVVITRVEPDSPAAQAGLKPGFVITQIASKPLSPMIKHVHERKMRPGMERMAVMFGILHRLNGPEGSKVEVTFLDAADKQRTVTLARRKPAGELVRFGELPPLYARMEHRLLPQDIGYIRFNIFLMPILAPIKQAIREMHTARGLIIDLRGNPGGVGAMTNSIANELYSKRDSLGAMKLRMGEMRFAVFPVSEPYAGPVVILTDEGSVSSSEILAGSLQESGRATVIGRPTPGMVLPSQFERLPGGARLQMAIADFRTPRGVLLEGRGVLPDIPVTLTRDILLTGADAVLTAAIDYLNNSLNESVNKPLNKPDDPSAKQTK